MEQEQGITKGGSMFFVSKSADWLKENYSIDLSREDEKEMASFLILWAIFEKEILRPSRSKTVAQQIICKSPLIVSDYSIPLKKVMSWYVDKHQANYIFSVFEFRSLKLKKKVQDFLHNIDTSASNEKIFVVSVIYQYRCNLFHGEKDLGSVPHSQREKFRTYNKFLIDCIIKWGKRNQK